jgi:hypothetical protein
VVDELMKTADVMKILKWCKKNRVSRVKLGSIEAEFTRQEKLPPAQPAPAEPPRDEIETSLAIEARDRKEYEELLTWSSS